MRQAQVDVRVVAVDAAQLLGAMQVLGGDAVVDPHQPAGVDSLDVFGVHVGKAHVFPLLFAPCPVGLVIVYWCISRVCCYK